MYLLFFVYSLYTFVHIIYTMFGELIGSKTRAALLRLFFLSPEGRFYLRQAARAVGRNPNAVRLELERLERVGLLKSEREANLKYYSLNKQNPLVKELGGVVLAEDSLERKEKALQEFVSKSTLAHKGEIEDITVFGSYARGDARTESDIDVLVTVKRGRFRMLRSLVEISYDLMLKYREYISVKTVTHDEKTRMLNKDSAFMKNVLKEGKVLYG